MKLCNFNYLKSISPDNPIFVTQMIQLFLKNVPLSIETMNNSLIIKDWNTIQHHAHKIRSDIECMGMPKLYSNIARQIEEYAKLQKQLDLMPELLLKLETALLEACKELKEV